MAVAGTLYVTSRIDQYGDSEDPRVATISKLRFVSTTVADVHRMVCRALSADAEATCLRLADTRAVLSGRATLMDAGIPNGARMDLIWRDPATPQRQRTPPAPSPKLVTSATLPVSPDGRRPLVAAASPSPQPANPALSIVRESPQSAAAPELPGDPVTVLDVSVQGAAGRPVCRLQHPHGLSAMSIGHIKSLAARVTHIDASQQRLFIGNRMRRDDEILGACLAPEEASGLQVPVARLFRGTLTASVVFEQDGAEFQVHELREDDTLVAVREALDSAGPELRQQYRGFDAFTCQMFVAGAAASSDDELRICVGDAGLCDLRQPHDGGVIRIVVRVAPQRSTGAASPNPVPPSPALAHSPCAASTVRADRLDPSDALDKAAPRDVSVIVINEEFETVSIGSPESARKPRRSRHGHNDDPQGATPHVQHSAHTPMAEQHHDAHAEHRSATPIDAARSDKAEEQQAEENGSTLTQVESTIVLSSHVVQAELAERQRARNNRELACAQFARRREELEAAAVQRRKRVAAIAEQCGLPPPSASNDGHADEAPKSGTTSRSHSVIAPADVSTVDRSAFVSLSPPRERHERLMRDAAEPTPGGASERSSNKPSTGHLATASSSKPAAPAAASAAPAQSRIDTRALIDQIKAANATGSVLGNARGLPSASNASTLSNTTGVANSSGSVAHTAGPSAAGAASGAASVRKPVIISLA